MSEPLFDLGESVTLTYGGQTWIVTLASVEDERTVILQSASDGGYTVYQAFRRIYVREPYHEGWEIRPHGGEHATVTACRRALDDARPSHESSPPIVRPLVNAALDGRAG